MNARGLGPYGWMVCGTLSFSFMVLLAHAAVDYCDWPIVLLARSGLVLLFAALLAWSGKVKLVFWGSPVLWLRSFAGSVSMVLTFYALTRSGVPASYVVTLTNLFPVWVAILSWPVLGEFPPTTVWLAVVSGVLGVVLIQDPSLPEGPIATWMAIGASLTSAVAMLGLHQLRGIDPLAIVVHFSGVATAGAIVVLGLFLWFDHAHSPMKMLAWEPIFLLVGIGVSAVFGQWCLTRAFTSGNPSRVSVLGLLQVVFVLILQTLGGHDFKWESLFGTLLILAPTAWIMLQRRPKHAAPLPIVTDASVAPPSVVTEPKVPADSDESQPSLSKTSTSDS